MPLDDLLQLDRPVGVIEEGTPGLILLMRQFQIEHGTAFGLFRLAYEVHMRLFRRPAALADVTGDAGTDDIFPSAHTALAARHDVIQTQLAGREFLAAVLTLIMVTGENISPVEFHRLFRQSVVTHETNDPRHLNFRIDSTDPVIFLLSEESSAVLADFAPGGEVIGCELAVFMADHFGQVLTEQAECSPDRDNVDSHEQFVQNKDAGVQSRSGTRGHQAPFREAGAVSDAPRRSRRNNDAGGER